MTMPDFESQNEEWIALHKRAMANADDVALHLVTRAGRLGTLQQALLDHQDGCNVSVNTLLRYAIQDMTFEVASNLRQLERLAPPRYEQPEIDSHSHITSLDVDAFFEEYSECMKPNWDEIAAFGTEEADDEEQTTEHRRSEKQAKRREAEHLLPQQNHDNRQLAPSETRLPFVASKPYNGKVTHNMNDEISSHMDMNDEISSHMDSRNVGTSNALHYTQGIFAQGSWGSGVTSISKRNMPNHQNPYQQQTHHLATSSWQNHESQQNPFQTARELAQSEDNDTTKPQDSGHNWNHQNPYSAHHPVNECINTGPLHGGPSIPDSLKRKFQPPKRLTDRQNSKGSYPIPNRNEGGVQDSRPSSNSSKNNKSSSNGNRKNNGSEDDDELPAELQHLDKELVKKIQNEIMESGDMVTFDDIAGLHDAKQTVQEVVCWPMKRPDLFTGLRRAPNGLLLYGPPGTGKTLIGKAIAYESGATFFSISSSSLTSKWIGEGEKLVRTLFAVAAYREPAVVFIDEIDSLLTQRKATENEASRRIKTEFLVQLDGTGTTGQGRVLVIGATNRPQELDEAARRRFTKRLYIPLPIQNDRSVLLHVMLDKNNHRLTDEEVEKLARETDGFSGADLKALCTDAAMGPIRQLGPKALSIKIKDVPPISFKHFRRSLKGTRPSVAPADLVQYEEWDKAYGSKRANEDDDSSDEE